MNFHPRFLLPLVLLASCALPADPDDVRRVAPNGMVPSALTAHREAATVAVGSALTAIDFSGLVQDAGGLALLRDMVECALTSDASLVVRVDGSDLRFSGLLGLAPSWTRRPMSAVERRWISGCLMARSNAFGVSVPVSLLGTTRALEATPQESLNFPVEEGAFYGDVFAAEASLFACRGTGALAAGGMRDRLCAVPDPERAGFTLCGFMLVGFCKMTCTSEDGFYADCLDNLGRQNSQVVTVHVTP